VVFHTPVRPSSTGMLSAKGACRKCVSTSCAPARARAPVAPRRAGLPRGRPAEARAAGSLTRPQHSSRKAAASFSSNPIRAVTITETSAKRGLPGTFLRHVRV